MKIPVTGDGAIGQIHAITRFFAPDEGCMWCNQLIDPTELAIDMHPEHERQPAATSKTSPRPASSPSTASPPPRPSATSCSPSPGCTTTPTAPRPSCTSPGSANEPCKPTGKTPDAHGAHPRRPSAAATTGPPTSPPAITPTTSHPDKEELVKKIIITALAGAVANCLVGHVADWCLFRTLGLRCPGEAQ